MTAPWEFRYEPPGPVAQRFLRDKTSFVKGMRGPIAGGKSVTCCIDLFMRTLEQGAGPTGIRKTRHAIIRNTTPELKTTTLNTWKDWFPEHQFGKIIMQPPITHRIKVGDIECEAIFLALDSEKDVKKLLSLELSAAWVNEAREVPKAIVDAVTSRVDRYPAKRDGGCTRPGVIMDTNSMEDDHWWPVMSGEAPPPEDTTADDLLMLRKPANWTFYTQPGGMAEHRDSAGNLTGYALNPRAENVANLSRTYYDNLIQGKRREWIKVYVLNQLGATSDSKLVYPAFNEETHVARGPIEIVPDLTIYAGVDFGLTPAAVFLQHVNGQWRIVRELLAQDMGAKRFAERMKIYMAQEFPDNRHFMMYGDPAGDSRAQTDETTPMQIMQAQGLRIIAAPSNDFVERIEAVDACIGRLVDGKPGLILDPRCSVLKAGFLRGYGYPVVIQQGGSRRWGDRPVKNRYSHPHDALQYALLGAGEGNKVRGAGGTARPVVGRRQASVFDRMSGRMRRSR